RSGWRHFCGGGSGQQPGAAAAVRARTRAGPGFAGDRPVIGIVLGVLLVGLVVRQWCERSEAWHLHLSVDILYPGDNEEMEVDPSLASTVLRRTRMALSAAKLMRLVSLLLLIPATTLLAVEALRLVGGEWDFAVLRIVAGTVLLFIIVFLLH